MEFYRDKDIAKLLGITVGGLKHKLGKGDPLPPRIRPPSCRYRLWPTDKVHAWLRKFEQHSSATRTSRSSRGKKASPSRTTGYRN